MAGGHEFEVIAEDDHIFRRELELGEGNLDLSVWDRIFFIEARYRGKWYLCFRVKQVSGYADFL